jgi:hypothetical protein
MTPIRKICRIILMMSLFVGCTEVYIPDIDSDSAALVVEGLITDGTGPFTVKLTRSVPFNSDSTSAMAPVEDAQLTVLDNEGGVYNLTYGSLGIYSLPTSFQAKVGNAYVLHIVTSDGQIYESSAQQLLPPASFDSIHVANSTEEYLDDENELTSTEGFSIRVDLFKYVSTVNPAPTCRFVSNIVVQYEFSYIDQDTFPDIDKATWCWDVFGWKAVSLDDNVNMTEQRSKTANQLVQGHLLCFVPKGTKIYRIDTQNAGAIITYYYRFKQYTINQDAYDFYQAANKQQDASGKIFDPITAQLTGNMKCLSDTTQVVLGLFEVSSETRGAFVLSSKPRQVPYEEVSERASYQYKVYIGPPTDDPPKEGDYEVIPYPSWWTHK